MADKIIKGKNVRLILDGKKIFHATECSIDMTFNLESIATKDTAGKISIPSDYEWTASLNALVAEKDPVSLTHHSFIDVVQKALAMEECTFQYTTDEEGEFLFTGKVFINQANITASTESSATGTFSFTGNGNLVLTEVPAP
jgi:hypothetical protein